MKLVPLAPKEIHEDQMKKSERKDNTKGWAESFEKKKKEREAKSERKEKSEKGGRVKKSFFAEMGEIRIAYKASHVMVLLVFKESYLTLDDTNSPLPSVVTSLLLEFEDVFIEEMPIGLPPITGIEH